MIGLISAVLPSVMEVAGRFLPEDKEKRAAAEREIEAVLKDRMAASEEAHMHVIIQQRLQQQQALDAAREGAELLAGEVLEAVTHRVNAHIQNRMEKPFYDIKVVITGLPKRDRKKVIEQVREMGGTVLRDLHKR